MGFRNNFIGAVILVDVLYSLRVIYIFVVGTPSQYFQRLYTRGQCNAKNMLTMRLHPPITSLPLLLAEVQTSGSLHASPNVQMLCSVDERYLHQHDQ